MTQFSVFPLSGESRGGYCRSVLLAETNDCKKTLAETHHGDLSVTGLKVRL